MLSFPAAIKVYLCTVPCDMRRSFNGLSMMAEHVVRGNPLSRHLFVFCNRRADRLKILYWNHDGLAIWYKRLEVGTFAYPFSETGRKEIAAFPVSGSGRIWPVSTVSPVRIPRSNVSFAGSVRVLRYHSAGWNASPARKLRWTSVLVPG